MHSGTETKDWKEYVKFSFPPPPPSLSLFFLCIPHKYTFYQSYLLQLKLKFNTCCVCRLLMELGYRLIPDSQSRAVSVIHLDDEFVTVETDHASLTAAAGVSSSDQDEALSREQLAELTMKHAEEMKLLQAEYE